MHYYFTVLSQWLVTNSNVKGAAELPFLFIFRVILLTYMVILCLPGLLKWPLWQRIL